ncbi:hypothetical protein SAMN05421821_102500 [Mucilaginibacter lappiensis]|uniref:Uncharacterized protein n=1 Tax=Mucilaginibacter lappiensis TaxID=354630 RepID=A0A1N6SVU3_9SPHI|nr:hypothetical protein [Mucilaginibacter lappiensis]MBB6129890.1 hypothetical protein [Mucilaginibacter lappiensis]SIQ44996.1 hypothetical protein SAMN05421821_102500 [Mucilaginibacter lappiensis]
MLCNGFVFKLTPYSYGFIKKEAIFVSKEMVSSYLTALKS